MKRKLFDVAMTFLHGAQREHKVFCRVRGYKLHRGELFVDLDRRDHKEKKMDKEQKGKYNRVKKSLLTATDQNRLMLAVLQSRLQSIQDAKRIIEAQTKRLHESEEGLPLALQAAEESTRAWKRRRNTAAEFPRSYSPTVESDAGPNQISTSIEQRPRERSASMSKGKKGKKEKVSKKDVERLVAALRDAEDPEEKRKLRRQLREAGHTGGLGEGRGRPPGSKKKKDKKDKKNKKGKKGKRSRRRQDDDDDAGNDDDD